jgi:hypothetical protein
VRRVISCTPPRRLALTLRARQPSLLAGCSILRYLAARAADLPQAARWWSTTGSWGAAPDSSHQGKHGGQISGSQPTFPPQHRHRPGLPAGLATRRVTEAKFAPTAWMWLLQTPPILMPSVSAHPQGMHATDHPSNPTLGPTTAKSLPPSNRPARHASPRQPPARGKSRFCTLAETTRSRVA